jgi:hypothetical protein
MHAPFEMEVVHQEPEKEKPPTNRAATPFRGDFHSELSFRASSD